MRFRAQHHYSGPVARVLAILGEPRFYLELALPDLSQPELVEEHRDGDSVLLALRYEFVGGLDPIAQRLIGPGRLTWLQEVRVDSSTHSGTLRFEAEQDPGRLHGDASFTCTETAGVTTRVLDGELVVRVPAVGRMAERRIVPGIVRRLDIEAQAVNERLAAD
jgi:hypothetical protein